jgi:hypothetical protein
LPRPIAFYTATPWSVRIPLIKRQSFPHLPDATRDG